MNEPTLNIESFKPEHEGGYACEVEHNQMSIGSNIAKLELSKYIHARLVSPKKQNYTCIGWVVHRYMDWLQMKPHASPWQHIDPFLGILCHVIIILLAW